jgi:dTDP-L-rhamnose 4-epimerase
MNRTGEIVDERPVHEWTGTDLIVEINQALVTHVLVTGGAGFIGSHIVDELVDEEYGVTVVDNLNEQVHQGKPRYLNDDARYVWGDVRDGELMAELLADADVLTHQASAVGVGQSMYDIERYAEVNTLATARMLDTIANEDIGLEKLIVASSMSIYGEGRYYCPDCETARFPGPREKSQLGRDEWEHVCESCGSTLEPEPIAEADNVRPTSVYASTKRSQEELVLNVGRVYDIPSVALRYFNVYGPRQSMDNPYTGVCSIFSSRIKNGNPPLIFEDGHQRRDFVHVEDVARVNVAAIESPVRHEAINVGSGEVVTINEVAELILAAYGVDDDLSPRITGDYREGDIRHCVGDLTKVRELLGFDPEWSLAGGIRGLVEWARTSDAEDNFGTAYAELDEQGLIDGGDGHGTQPSE